MLNGTIMMGMKKTSAVLLMRANNFWLFGEGIKSKFEKKQRIVKKLQKRYLWRIFYQMDILKR